MQGLIVPPRDGLTAAQVIALIQDSEAPIVSAGIEALDRGLNFLFDFTDDFAGGSVTRGSFNTLHASCTLQVSKTDLDWGRTIARPYMILSADGISARFNLGAFFLTTPRQTFETSPRVFEVQGFDILHALADPVGEAYSVNAGVKYLEQIEEILLQRGYTKYIIDQSAEASVLPAAKVWVIDERTSWLTVVNDLLAAIGYQGIWSDWDGQLRVQPYEVPSDRGAEWTYDSTIKAISMLSPQRVVEDDWFDAPNRWVAIRQNNVENTAPVEGDGIYTFNNFATGKTSQSARDRVITKPFMVDAASQSALVSAARVTVDADMRRSAKLIVKTFPNPLHWHFDRMLVNDPDMGSGLQVMSTSWSLPLNGEDMSHEWSVII